MDGTAFYKKRMKVYAFYESFFTFPDFIIFPSKFF